MIPEAFPEQHCGARPVLGAGRQRNSTLNGQAVAPSQVGRQPHNSRQSDAIAKKRQRPRAQMQTWDNTDVPAKRPSLGLARGPHGEKATYKFKRLASIDTAV